MFKKLFFVTLCLSFSLSLKAGTVIDANEIAKIKALYGDFVNCYYELNQNPADTNYFKKEFVPISKEYIKTHLVDNKAAKELLATTNNDAYFFSYEGFFGLAPSAEDRKVCDFFHGSEAAEHCAFDFKVRAGKSIYDLCYIKEWNGEYNGINSYLENVYAGACNENGIISHNSKTISKGIPTTKQLHSRYFSTILYPLLQNDYETLVRTDNTPDATHLSACKKIGIVK